jgi:hypothetical protein
VLWSSHQCFPFVAISLFSTSPAALALIPFCFPFQDQDGGKITRRNGTKNRQHAGYATHKTNKKRHHLHDSHLPRALRLLAHTRGHPVFTTFTSDRSVRSHPRRTRTSTSTLLGPIRLKRHRSNHPNRLHRARRQIPDPPLDFSSLLQTPPRLLRLRRILPRLANPRRPKHSQRNHQIPPPRFRTLPPDPIPRQSSLDSLRTKRLPRSLRAPGRQCRESRVEAGQMEVHAHAQQDNARVSG